MARSPPRACFVGCPLRALTNRIQPLSVAPRSVAWQTEVNKCTKPEETMNAYSWLLALGAAAGALLMPMDTT